MEQKKFSLNRNQIKYILIAAMLIDHIAWGFVRYGQPGYFSMHFIGRLTGPCMAYFLAEGYLHTSDFKKYARRLGIFALLSWPAFVWFEYGALPLSLRDGYVATPKGAFGCFLSHSRKTLLFYPRFGVIYTLFLALLALYLFDRIDLPPLLREGGIVGLGCLSLFGDWAVYDLLFALCFHRFRKEPKKMWLLYVILSFCSFSYNGFTQKGLFQLGMLLVPVLLFFYDQKPGSRHPFHKWFFYFFYPLHLLLLGWIRWRM
ncbi:MAG: conjugal transfer protein TraX [Lachnospiraceae bacterium]|nr:conjugal transfer protein TraX [Lachnospiraceae bacterium]